MLPVHQIAFFLSPFLLQGSVNASSVLFTWQIIKASSGDHTPRGVKSNWLLAYVNIGEVKHLLLLWVPLLLPLLLLCSLQEVVEGVGLGARVGRVEGKWSVELALVPAVIAALGAGKG